MPRLRNETRDMEFRDLRDEAGDGTHQEKAQQLSNFRGTAQYCQHEGCRDSRGRPKKQFGRRVDLKRHDKSIHTKVFFDCPKMRCSRKRTGWLLPVSHKNFTALAAMPMPAAATAAGSTMGASCSKANADGE